MKSLHISSYLLLTTSLLDSYSYLLEFQDMRLIDTRFVDKHLANVSGFAVDKGVKLANSTTLPVPRLRIAFAEKILGVTAKVAMARDRQSQNHPDGLVRRMQWCDYNPLSCEAGEQLEALHKIQEGKTPFYYLARGNRYRRPQD